MDDETAEIRRRIAEARGVQERLTQMQNRIRREHDRLEDVLRGFRDEDGPRVHDPMERMARRDAGARSRP